MDIIFYLLGDLMEPNASESKLNDKQTIIEIYDKENNNSDFKFQKLIQTEHKKLK